MLLPQAQAMPDPCNDQAEQKNHSNGKQWMLKHLTENPLALRRTKQRDYGKHWGFRNQEGS